LPHTPTDFWGEIEREMAITIESIKKAVTGLQSLLPVGFKPEIGIIGGSGLSALEDAVLEPRWEVPYGSIKGFPVSTGKSHFAICWLISLGF
jgi:purine-nucleoside phosphorylase